MTQTQSDTRFWTPEFAYEHRPDGTVLMWQEGELGPSLPTLAAYLDKWADLTPDHAWIARRENGGDWRKITYAQARTAARAIGAGLLALGLGPSRPLMILSENSLEHALIGIAALYVGVPYAPISPAYSLISKDHAKIKTIADTLNPGAFFADDGAAFATALAALAADDRHVICARNVIEGAIALDDLQATDPAPALAARDTLTGETVAKYMLTSGSTGSPKAVINTNKMLCTSQAMVRDCFRYITQKPPVVLNWAPWNHTAAGNKVFNLVLTNGGTYYIDDGRPVPGKFDETLRNLREVSCSWYFNIPLAYDKLAEAMETDTALAETFFAELGMLFYAGAGMAQHTWDRLMAVGKSVTGRDVVLATGLGSTETAPFALAWTTPEDTAGNVGVPAKGLTLKLVPNNGKLEARLKGPTITPGYFDDPEKTAEAFDDEGFYCLGDALRPVDPDDFSRGFFFDGRVAENFKLSTATWVSVGSVRAALVDAMGGLLRDAVIVGENEPQLGALMLLSPEAEAMDPAERAAALQTRLTAAAKAATGSAARVRRALVLTEAPDFARGEVTEKGSLNQRAMRANNEDLIAQLYAGGDGVILA